MVRILRIETIRRHVHTDTPHRTYVLDILTYMKAYRVLVPAVVAVLLASSGANAAHAALTLTAGSNATTTPNVATSITGFQIVGPAASTTPVQLRTTSGSLSLGTTTGLTFDGSSSGSTINFTGTVANINAALATLRYSRASTGTDTLEVSLINKGEIFFTENNHLYKFISGSFNWSAARTAAEAQTAYGATGYLVTITSNEENEFVSDRLTGDGWIGASDSETEGTWKWVTGPEAGTAFWQGTGGGSAVSGRFEAWAGGEPNQAGEEDCAETYVSSGTWNDFPCGASLGYVVEFGADGNMPTVVAQNISIVTADVPAVTSLSPANGALAANPTANLVIGFSKSVTKQTGSILIRKSSDDSIAETIDAAGSLVSGSGSSTITINPDSTLEEGTSYYVTVPGTAFKDASDNFFDGISGSSTWTFTTSDVTAPVITNVATSSVATTTASVTWTTNEAASTKLVYSTGTSYASSTSETDTSSRVTSHTKSLTDLSACTSYNFKAVSADAAGNYATSTSGMFTTLGCAGYSIPSSATTTSVTVSATSTTSLTDSGRTLTVETPANFTATSSTVVIQIRAMAADPVIESISMPLDVYQATSVVFDVTALVNSSVMLDSFDTPVTITYTYTDEDIAGLEESSLSMYHYHDDVWEELDDCSVSAGTNTITCTAPSFSIFGIFGTPSVASSNSSTGGKTGTSVRTQVANLERSGNIARAEEIKSEWPSLFASTNATPTTSTSAGTAPVRDLELGMEGEDVRLLQKFLNANGYALASSGVGAPGSETTYFGTLTQNALIKFQAAKAITPSAGYFGPITRAKIDSEGLGGKWW